MSAKVPGTGTRKLKKFAMQRRKLLHSFFRRGRMRAVQGLEDSARFFVSRSGAAILYGRLANCSNCFS
jgi:hypothetical protein